MLIVSQLDSLPFWLAADGDAAGSDWPLGWSWYVWVVIAWIMIINGLAFMACGLDKWKARRKAKKPQVQRIRERTLWLYGLLGGIWGLIFGMRTFRHKTRKQSFIVATVVIAVINIGYYVTAFVVLSRG